MSLLSKYYKMIFISFVEDFIIDKRYVDLYTRKILNFNASISKKYLSRKQ